MIGRHVPFFTEIGPVIIANNTDLWLLQEVAVVKVVKVEIEPWSVGVGEVSLGIWRAHMILWVCSLLVVKRDVQFVKQYDSRLRTWHRSVVFRKQAMTSRFFLVSNLSLFDQASTVLFLNLLSQFNCFFLRTVRILIGTLPQIMVIYYFWNIFSNHVMHFFLSAYIISTYFWIMELPPWRLSGIFHSEECAVVGELFVRVEMVDEFFIELLFLGLVLHWIFESLCFLDVRIVFALFVIVDIDIFFILCCLFIVLKGAFLHKSLVVNVRNVKVNFFDYFAALLGLDSTAVAGSYSKTFVMGGWVKISDFHDFFNNLNFFILEFWVSIVIPVLFRNFFDWSWSGPVRVYIILINLLDWLHEGLGLWRYFLWGVRV